MPIQGSLPGVPPVIYDSRPAETSGGFAAIEVVRRSVRWLVQSACFLNLCMQQELQQLSDAGWTIYSASKDGVIAYRYEEVPSDPS